MLRWLARQWRYGDTAMWLCLVVCLLAAAGIILALTVPPR